MAPKKPTRKTSRKTAIVVRVDDKPEVLAPEKDVVAIIHRTVDLAADAFTASTKLVDHVMDVIGTINQKRK